MWGGAESAHTHEHSVDSVVCNKQKDDMRRGLRLLVFRCPASLKLLLFLFKDQKELEMHLTFTDPTDPTHCLEDKVCGHLHNCPSDQNKQSSSSIIRV